CAREVGYSNYDHW
nr:immunoglobulin heavy chain junction region [Macaca mulatta]MOW91962.1 immunoglobulin heavy chain junction region [Macaca mulatta]MOW92521.1 immunoglobulin heavy chain junction region [Macaca mulatta]